VFLDKYLIVEIEYFKLRRRSHILYDQQELSWLKLAWYFSKSGNMIKLY